MKEHTADITQNYMLMRRKNIILTKLKVNVRTSYLGQKIIDSFVISFILFD